MGIGRTLSKSLITLRLAIRVNMRSDPMPARAGSWQGDTFTPPPQRSVFEPTEGGNQINNVVIGVSVDLDARL
jgi:hypothetical protein